MWIISRCSPSEIKSLRSQSRALSLLWGFCFKKPWIFFEIGCQLLLTFFLIYDKIKYYKMVYYKAVQAGGIIMKKMTTKDMVLAAILTAIVVVLQFWGATIKLGPFSVSAVLVPIVIGAATCGVGIGAWLGFVFGVIVLVSGDAAAFLAVDVAGTVITVLAKGTLCGLLAGVTYKAFANVNSYLAAVLAALVCPLVNTGIFLLGCLVFFMDTISQWAEAANLGGNVAQYMIVGLVGVNFLVEVLVNIVLSPVIVRLINARK